MIRYSDPKDYSWNPSLMLLVTIIFLAILFSKLDQKLNKLTYLKNMSQIEIEAPTVSSGAQEQLLKEGEEKEYTLKLNSSSIRKTLKSIAESFVSKRSKRTSTIEDENASLRRTDSLVLRMRNFGLRKGVMQIFDNFRITFMSNRVNCIIGKNGSGKSMIFR